MCGIFGIFNGESNNIPAFPKLINNMAYAGTVRGVDGLGFLQVERKVKKDNSEEYCPFINKDKTFSVDDIENGDFSQVIADSQSSLLTLGHHRAATVGKITKAASQPFMTWREDGTWFGGVHNGTLSAWTEKADGNVYNSDSEWAINQLAKDYRNALERHIRGAYTFVTYDSREPDKLTVATSGHRPFAFAFLKDHKGMVMASEVDMLAWLCNRNKLAIIDAKYYECQADRIYKFDINNLVAYSNLPIIKTYPPVQSQSSDNYWNRSNRAVSDSATPSTMEADIKKIIKDAIHAAKKKLPLPASQNFTKREGAARVPLALSVPPLTSPTTGTTSSRSEPVSRAGPPLNTEEARCLRHELNYVVGQECDFYPVSYNKERQVLIGTCLITDEKGHEDMHDCLIRAVSTMRGEGLIDYSNDTGPSLPVRVKALGAYKYARTGGNRGIDIMIVADHPAAHEMVRISKAMSDRAQNSSSNRVKRAATNMIATTAEMS